MWKVGPWSNETRSGMTASPYVDGAEGVSGVEVVSRALHTTCNPGIHQRVTETPVHPQPLTSCATLREVLRQADADTSALEQPSFGVITGWARIVRAFCHLDHVHEASDASEASEAASAVTCILTAWHLATDMFKGCAELVGGTCSCGFEFSEETSTKGDGGCGRGPKRTTSRSVAPEQGLEGCCTVGFCAALSGLCNHVAGAGGETLMRKARRQAPLAVPVRDFWRTMDSPHWRI